MNDPPTPLVGLHLNTRVSSVEDITGMTQVPVLAEIGHSTGQGIIAVGPQSRQLAAEHLRGLRTNLQYLLTGKEEKAILITSSMSGEGKSFLSINLCLTLALAGKKVILLELDLRNPKISAALELSKDGLSKSGENALLDLQFPHPPDIGSLPQRSQTPAQTRRRNYFAGSTSGFCQSSCR